MQYECCWIEWEPYWLLVTLTGWKENADEWIGDDIEWNGNTVEWNGNAVE